MFVAATTDCFRDLPLDEAFEKLVDLEYTNIELCLHEGTGHLSPSQITEDLPAAVKRCQSTRRLNVIGYSVMIDATGDEYYRQFEAICKLAKATKVVTLTVPSAELGTPFNEEVEHLNRLVDLATLEGVVVSVKTESGRLSADPDSMIVLCDNVEGLGITLDPSHYIWGDAAGKNYERLLKYVSHVRLRDTSKEHLQVRVGQGEVDYGKIVLQLQRQGYNRALCVDMQPIDGVDHMGEMRKIRLLLDSLL